MIDLRKPLEGVPGLLLMAALIFFGMVVGVTIALLCSWIEMKDSVANFLGGVVGAALGSALAVLGAVYVQRQERRHQMSTALNPLLVQLKWFEARLDAIKSGIRGQSLINFLGPMDEAIHRLPDGEQLSAELYEKITVLKKFWGTRSALLRSFAERWDDSAEHIRESMARDIGEIRELLEKL